MNKLSTYLGSLAVSVFLVLAIIAASAALLLDINVTRDKALQLAEREMISEKVYSEIEKYYTDKYGSSGIPVSVYMDGISREYVNDCVKNNISAAFNALEKGSGVDITVAKNDKLENNIKVFFNNYAEKEGYIKDEKYERCIRLRYSSLLLSLSLVKSRAVWSLILIYFLVSLSNIYV